MNQSSSYYKQVDMLIDILNLIQDNNIALKGGTAINLFFRQMPRLSVDIDLAYTAVNQRDLAIREINSFMNLLDENITKKTGYKVIKNNTKDLIVSQLTVIFKTITVKVEINHVIRGCVFEPQRLDLCKVAQTEFKKTASIKVLSFADVYAGKLCAALDRQHPRDLFDILLLLENEGLTSAIMQAFIVYLLSSPRPLHEMLNPNMLETARNFEKEFNGMTSRTVTKEELQEVQKKLKLYIKSNLTPTQKEFLISFEKCIPQWNLINKDDKDFSIFPAIRWKLQNLEKLMKSNNEKYQLQLNLLEKSLE